MELSALYGRYGSTAMRTVSIGPPPDQVKRAHDAALASVSALVENIRPGANGRIVAQGAAAALRTIEPNLVWHGYYGYSLGSTFPPAGCDCKVVGSINERHDLIFKPGMVFHCNTSFRDARRFGVAVGETVLVTDDGCEVLTTAPRELLVR